MFAFEPEVVEVTLLESGVTSATTDLMKFRCFLDGTGLIREMFSFLCHEDRRFVEEAALGQTKQERINKNICGCEI
jgi:hypothetical protein